MNALNPTRNHRTPIPTAAVAWAFLLLLLPPMACSGTASTPLEEAPAAQGDLIARLPAKATTVGYVDFAALRNSPVYEYLKNEGSGFGDPGRLEDMVGRTGIDPRTDLHRIAFVSGTSLVKPDPATSGVIVVATFDRARVLESLGGHEPERYEGHDLYTIASWSRRAGDDDASADNDASQEDDDSSEDDDDASEHDDSDDDGSLSRSYMTILDDSTLAFGGGETLRRIIDVARGEPSARTNDELMGLLEDVDPDSQVWTVSAHTSLLGDISAPEGTPMPQIPVDRIDALIMSIRLTDGIAMKLRGRTADQADAKLLGDSLNGMLAFGKMMLQSRTPEIFEILDRGVRAGSSGRDVTVSADLSMADIEALRQYAEKTIGDREAD